MNSSFHLTEDNAAFIYKLETIVRAVVKELSEPIVKKCIYCILYLQRTQECFSNFSEIFDLINDNKTKYTSMTGQISALELKLNFKSHELDTLNQKVYDLNNKFIQTSQTSHQSIDSMRILIEQMASKHKNKDDYINIIDQRTDNINETIKQLQQSINDQYIRINQTVQKHQKEILNELTQLKIRTNHLDDSTLEQVKLISSFKDQFQQIDQKFEIGKLEKGQIKEAINSIKTQCENSVTINALNEFKSVYQTQRNGEEERINHQLQILNNKLQSNQENSTKELDLIQKSLVEQKSINDQLKYIIEEKFNHQIQIIATKNQELMKEIEQMTLTSNSKYQSYEATIRGINEQLEQHNAGIKKEGQRLKDLNEKFEKRFIAEAEITEKKITIVCDQMSQKLAKDLTSFFDQRCMKMIQAQVMQNKNIIEEDNIVTNVDKFKIYLKEQISLTVEYYIKNQDDFQIKLRNQIEVQICEEKKGLNEQLLEISKTKQFINVKLSDQQTKLEEISSWMITNRNDIENQLRNINEQSNIIAQKTDQINIIKSELDEKITSIHTLTEDVVRKLNRVNSQQIQLKSDIEIQNEYLNKQIKYLNKETDKININIGEVLNWLTILHESINITLCVLLESANTSTSIENDFIAIPTFLDGILYQKSSTQQKDEISFRMNKFLICDLVWQTLIAIQHKYKDIISGNLVKQISMKCQDFFKEQILDKAGKQFKKKLRPQSLKKENKVTEIDVNDFNNVAFLKQKGNLSQEKVVTSAQLQRRERDRLLSTNYQSTFANTFNYNSPSQERIHSQSVIKPDRAKGKFIKPYQRKNIQQSMKVKVANLQNALGALKTE